MPGTKELLEQLEAKQLEAEKARQHLHELDERYQKYLGEKFNPSIAKLMKLEREYGQLKDKLVKERNPDVPLGKKMYASLKVLTPQEQNHVRLLLAPLKEKKQQVKREYDKILKEVDDLTLERMGMYVKVDKLKSKIGNLIDQIFEADD